MHGANRLASNSLLEGLVFARRIAARLLADPPPVPGRGGRPSEPGLIDKKVVPAMQKSMSRNAGGLRDAGGLDRCAADLTRLTTNGSSRPGVATWEATNLLTVAAAVVVAARTREESRGAHWRADAEGRRDEWLGHLLLELVPSDDGEPRLRRRFVPVGGAVDDRPQRPTAVSAR